MVKVLASPRSVPELIDGLNRRRADGRASRDGWRDGVLHVAGPVTPEEGCAVARLCAHLVPLGEALGLAVATSAAIGRPGEESRAPAIVVFDEATPRTAPDGLATAELVVEVVGADGRDEPDLAFFTRWRVREHLTVELPQGLLTLRRATADGWSDETRSHVLGFDVVDDEIVSMRGRLSL
jgi:hypothetical protein